MSKPEKFSLIVSNELLPDIQEAINNQIITITDILISNYPKVSLDNGIEDAISKHSELGILDLLHRIQKLDKIALKLDEYSYLIN